MRIGILGTGAMGSLFAAHLAPHAPVVALGTWQEGVDAINANGVRLERAAETLTVPVRAVHTPAQAGTVELAIVAVKAYQTERAAQWAEQILAPDGIALTLQNGLGNLEIIAAHVGPARATMGVTMQGATLLGPGHVRHAGHGLTTLAATPSTRDQIEAAAELFRRAGLETRVAEDVQSLMWSKLVVNSAINALTAIYRVPNGWLVQDPEARKLMSAAAQETARVAQALGIPLPFSDPAARAMQVAAATATNRSSTLQDILRGTPTELDRINGIVIREGKRLGIPTPVNEKLMRLVRNPRLARRRVPRLAGQSLS